MSIGSFSVKNSVLLNILMVSILVLGYLSLSRLPREQFSEVPFYWVIINVPYPGTSPFDIERTVAVPIENEMEGLPRVREIQSVVREGLAVVQVQFEEGMSREEFASLFNEVQNRFGRVELPDGTLEPVVTDFSSADFLPVVEVVLYGDVDSTVLVSQARRLGEVINALPDVSRVTSVGAPKRQIRIQAERSALEATGISLEQVVGAVGGANVSVPGGLLTTPSRQYLVRTVEEKKRAEDFNDIIIRPSTPEEGLVGLTDVAEVEETLDPRGAVARYNTTSAVSLQVTKVTASSSIEVVDEIKRVVREFSPSLPSGLKTNYLNDTTVRIRRSINVLVTNAVFGFFLLLLVLWYFVGIRNSFMISLGIPITFSITFVVMEIMGETLNGNTLFALVLVLGLIVDHAIIIVENSYRIRQRGLLPSDAAIKGTDEVVSPVTAATATTVAAFLPLMIVPGLIGRFLRVIPMVVTIALVASTFEALFFLPTHFAHWSSHTKIPKKRKTFTRLEDYWSRVLRWMYRNRYKTALVSVGFLGLVVVALTYVRQDLFTGEEYSYFYMEIDMPPGTPKEKTSQTVEQYENVLRPKLRSGTVRSVFSVIGEGGQGLSTLSLDNLARIIVELPEREEGRERSVLDIMNEVRDSSRRIAGPDNVLFRTVQGGPPVDDPVSMRLYGDDYENLFSAADKFKRQFGEYSQLYNIRNNIERGTPEFLVNVDLFSAARYGLTVESVGTYIRALFDGVLTTTIFDRNEDVDVMVTLDPEDINSAAQFKTIDIPSRSGSLVPFSSVASFKDTATLASIRRRNGRRLVTVSAQAFEGTDLTEINQELIDYYQNNLESQYPRIELEPGGEFEEFQNILADILRLFLVGVFLMYVILGSLFNSYFQPLLLMFTIPFAFAGVVIYLFIANVAFSTVVMYAGVALAGIAVNDSIVLISFINRNRRKQDSIKEAVVEGVKTRLRPIILTSVTTIGGLLPTALGLGGSSPVWGPMASTIIFGLLFSTFTALFIIPCYYYIGADAGIKFAGWKNRLSAVIKRGKD
ncbi:MAG: efflux RND transporter permease subunit [Chitinispirillaceae bacterium]